MAVMKEEELQAQETESRVYEVGYLLLPYVTEENLAREAGLIKEAITAAGGSVFSDEEPHMLTLAYPMFKVVSNKKTKFENAYFGWVKFDGDPRGLVKLKKAMEENENVLRFLIIKTIRENTLTKKPVAFVAKTMIKAPVMEEKEAEMEKDAEIEKAFEAPEVINEEALDKTIDDLVID